MTLTPLDGAWQVTWAMPVLLPSPALPTWALRHQMSLSSESGGGGAWRLSPGQLGRSIRTEQQEGENWCSREPLCVLDGYRSQQRPDMLSLPCLRSLEENRLPFPDATGKNVV